MSYWPCDPSKITVDLDDYEQGFGVVGYLGGILKCFVCTPSQKSFLRNANVTETEHKCVHVRYVELHSDNIEYPAIIDIVSRNSEKKGKIYVRECLSKKLIPFFGNPAYKRKNQDRPQDYLPKDGDQFVVECAAVVCEKCEKEIDENMSETEDDKMLVTRNRLLKAKGY